MSYRLISILSLIFCYIVFASFIITQSSRYSVIKVITPSEIVVDLNNNRKQDSNELICLPEIITFNTYDNSEIENKLEISTVSAIKMGYLAQEFAEKELLNKKVKLRLTTESIPKCRYADIYINEKSYSEKLKNSGFGITKFKKTKQFETKLKEANKLDLVILNHNSNKYHKPDCKYGKVARDSILIPTNQLPKNTTPCKFCHSKKIKEQIVPQILSNGWVKIFLTDFTKHTKPHNNCITPVCKEVLSQINNSTHTIDIALYGYQSIPEIEKALVNAKQRGVSINIVYDENSYYPQTTRLIKLANISSTDTPKILMHNKFIIFDDSTTITGSMNFAPTGFSEFNSNCVFLIKSPEIARIYKQEFNQMLSGKFHQEKITIQTKTININDTKVTPYFSPKHKTITKEIIPLINSAKNYIYIPTFLLTHDGLANALINAKNRNVTVKIITDATNINSTRSKIKLLRNSGIEIKTENFAGKMHAKTILIDDKYIIAGSMNFSNSGENRNDENCLIIENEKLTKNYKEFFEYLWNKIPEKNLTYNILAESKESIGSCNDGIDNDYDGKIDIADEGCK